MPSAHDGSNDFTIQLKFSKEVVAGHQDFNWSVFQVTGGTVKNARRLASPSNTRWEIAMIPSGNDAISSNDAISNSNAISTCDARPLFIRLEVAVAGPGG